MSFRDSPSLSLPPTVGITETSRPGDPNSGLYICTAGASTDRSTVIQLVSNGVEKELGNMSPKSTCFLHANNVMLKNGGVDFGFKGVLKLMLSGLLHGTKWSSGDALRQMAEAVPF